MARVTRGRVLAALQVVFAVVVLIAVAVALYRNWSAFTAELGRMPGAALAEAAGWALLAPVVTLLGWRTLLSDLGSRLPLPAASSVFLVGQLGKYLPGSVWTIVAQAEMGSRLRVPRRRMAVTGLLTLGLAVVAGGLLGLPALPLLLQRAGGGVPPWLVWLAVGVGLTCCLPPLLNRLIALLLRVARREPLEHALSARAIVLSMLWLVAGWATMGLSTLAMARALAPEAATDTLLIACVHGYALAGVAGMLGFVAPAGVGVRDGLLAVLLTTLMPLPAATAIVVVSRFLTVLVDILVAALAWAWARAHHLVGRPA